MDQEYYNLRKAGKVDDILLYIEDVVSNYPSIQVPNYIEPLQLRIKDFSKSKIVVLEHIVPNDISTFTTILEDFFIQNYHDKSQALKDNIDKRYDHSWNLVQEAQKPNYDKTQYFNILMESNGSSGPTYKPSYQMDHKFYIVELLTDKTPDGSRFYFKDQRLLTKSYISACSNCHTTVHNNYRCEVKCRTCRVLGHSAANHKRWKSEQKAAELREANEWIENIKSKPIRNRKNPSPKKINNNTTQIFNPISKNKDLQVNSFNVFDTLNEQNESTGDVVSSNESLIEIDDEESHFTTTKSTTKPTQQTVTEPTTPTAKSSNKRPISKSPENSSSSSINVGRPQQATPSKTFKSFHNETPKNPIKYSPRKIASLPTTRAGRSTSTTPIPILGALMNPFAAVLAKRDNPPTPPTNQGVELNNQPDDKPNPLIDQEQNQMQLENVQTAITNPDSSNMDPSNEVSLLPINIQSSVDLQNITDGYHPNNNINE
ncbi:hypothetical protein DFJ63DRAFT_311667 [Scheffersomyces coipomensis]|uniref:uncharacterized protein n=1 Tax=Scheffersomyces coipomensis TaxID=1788519 RepID=UPI00315CDC93